MEETPTIWAARVSYERTADLVYIPTKPTVKGDIMTDEPSEGILVDIRRFA